MTWQSDEAFLAGLEFFSGVVRQVPEDGWEHQSACQGWRLIDVVGHVGGVVKFGTALMNGEKPPWSGAPESPGNAVEGDPAAWWSTLVGPAQKALAGSDLAAVVDSPTGRRSIEEGLAFPAIDCFVHAWDIAHPLKISADIPSTAVAFAHNTLATIPDDLVRGPGVFGPSLEPPPGANEADRFLAWTGRNAS